jgi:hypothetical protein
VCVSHPLGRDGGDAQSKFRAWSRDAPEESREWGSGVEETHETLDTLQQIRSKLDEARTLSRSLGTPEQPYHLEVTLDTMIMGIDAQIGAVERAGEPDTT